MKGSEERVESLCSKMDSSESRSVQFSMFFAAFPIVRASRSSLGVQATADYGAHA